MKKEISLSVVESATRERQSSTPKPWTAEMGIAHNLIFGPDGVACIATIHRDIGDGDSEPDANAAFIVRACNSHGALLEALTDCIETICTYQDRGSRDDRENLNRAETQARAAIAQATGEKD